MGCRGGGGPYGSRGQGHGEIYGEPMELNEGGRDV